MVSLCIVWCNESVSVRFNDFINCKIIIKFEEYVIFMII